MVTLDAKYLESLKAQVRQWASSAGFSEIRVCDIDLSAHDARFRRWLQAGLHGDMGYMAQHMDMRLKPDQLLPGTARVLSARMPYQPDRDEMEAALQAEERGYVSRYATGRDYHKVLRRRLARIAKQINEAVQPNHHVYRAFTDSAPVLEKALATKAGHGWVGRHSLVLNENDGSWFFLGEIFTNIPLPLDGPDSTDRCGACRACVSVCPTDAILPDRTIDARRCISYLTIENKGSIPEEFRSAMGNRVFGCDDCQIFCPYNRPPLPAAEADFAPREPLASATLDEMFQWSEAEYLKHTEGTAVRRTGYEGWRRNVATALGNAPYTPERLELLANALPSASPMVAEHIRWAITQLEEKSADL